MTLGDGAARHSNSCCAPCCSGGGTASIVGIHRSAVRFLFLHIFRRTRDGVLCTVVVQGIDQPVLAVFLVSRRPDCWTTRSSRSLHLLRESTRCCPRPGLPESSATS